MENEQKKSALPISIDPPNGGLVGFLFAIGAILVGLVEIAFLGWFLPRNIELIRQDKEKAEVLSAETVKLEKALATLSTLNAAQLSGDLEFAEEALPSEKRVSGLIPALTNLASSSGASVNELEISFGKVSTRSGSASLEKAALGKGVILKDDVVGVPINMSVAATYEQLLAMVGKIQESLPLLDILTFEYSNVNRGRNGQLSVLIYSQVREVFDKTKLDKVSPLSGSEVQAIAGLRRKVRILP